jgi:hypothetical protein
MSCRRSQRRPARRSTSAARTAIQVDFAHVLAGKLPLFIGIVVLLSALLLLVVFRSLLIPLQAALMNLLSIAAALGVVQAIFERGWLAGLIGVQPGPIEAFIPVMVFAIVFGLSMDYEVFLVSASTRSGSTRRRKRRRAGRPEPHRPGDHRRGRGHGRRLRLLRSRRRPGAEAASDLFAIGGGGYQGAVFLDGGS